MCHLHRMALAMTRIRLALHDDPDDDSPDLGGNRRRSFWTGTGTLLGIKEEMTLTFRQVKLSSNMDLEEILRHTILEAVLLYRYQRIVILPWSSYLMEPTVHHQMMTIRRILWKFIRSLLLLEDLQMHQGQNSLLPTRTKLCNRHLTCHRPLLNRLFHFRSIHIFRFQESCVRRHLGMFR